MNDHSAGQSHWRLDGSIGRFGHRATAGCRKKQKSILRSDHHDFLALDAAVAGRHQSDFRAGDLDNVGWALSCVHSPSLFNLTIRKFFCPRIANKVVIVARRV